jgi:hypothetical protein
MRLPRTLENCCKTIAKHGRNVISLCPASHTGSPYYTRDALSPPRSSADFLFNQRTKRGVAHKTHVISQRHVLFAKNSVPLTSGAPGVRSRPWAVPGRPRPGPGRPQLARGGHWPALASGRTAICRPAGHGQRGGGHGPVSRAWPPCPGRVSPPYLAVFTRFCPPSMVV